MKKIVLILILLLCPVFPALAVTVGEAVITRGVSERVPVDRVEVYRVDAAKGAGRLFCFSRIDGAAADTSIEHVWYYGEREMARVELPVRSSRWRTYSSKKILAQWVGVWRVQIVTAEGTLLQELAFRVE